MLAGVMGAAKKGISKVEDTVNEKRGKNKSRDKAASAHSHTKQDNSQDYARSAAECIPSDVRMFSGCMDHQTSADVSNVASFGLPPVSGPEKAGGACTNALLSVYNQQRDTSFGELLMDMQKVLKQRKYTQIPQLSSSKQINLKEEKFTLHNPRPSGRTKALLIGINYYGQKGELSGCVNDVKQMKNFIVSHGYSDALDRMQILTDDAGFTNAQPTGDNIIAAMKWLVTDNQPGDSLFFHYSGHGGQIEDDNGDEEDGMDETLVPADYAQSGQIRDDLIFKLLVVPLKAGVHMVAVFDCCHSGTILDLPYMFVANDAGCAAVGDGSQTGMAANPFFSLIHALEAAADVARGLIGGLTGKAQRGLAKSAVKNPNGIGAKLGKLLA